MKITTNPALATYESPALWVIEFDTQSTVCTSPSGLDNEEYEDGDTSGWYN